MAKKSFPSVKIAGEKRVLNTRKDTPDCAPESCIRISGPLSGL